MKVLTHSKFPQDSKNLNEFYVADGNARSNNFLLYWPNESDMADPVGKYLKQFLSYFTYRCLKQIPMKNVF